MAEVRHKVVAVISGKAWAKMMVGAKKSKEEKK